jgi:hypothetical protein
MRWKKLVEHLNANGVRAPATVVEISRYGSEVKSGGVSPLDLVGLGGGNKEWRIHKTKLLVRPAGEPEFEVETKMRYGGGYIARVPSEGDEFDVLYDPADHENIMLAPPTAEQEAIRTANALNKADIGIQIGGGGAKAGAKPVTKEEVEERVKSMDEQMQGAQAMLEQMQQFTSGQDKPGSEKREKE